MNICLVSTPTRTKVATTYPPLGLMMLASYMETFGHNVKIIDLAKERYEFSTVCNLIKQHDAQVVGIGGIITAYRYIIELTTEIRQEISDINIILGGPVVINNAANCFRHMPIDMIVNGYGEIPLVKILDSLSSGRSAGDIPGIAYRSDGGYTENPGREYVSSVDVLPFPAYHLVDMEYYCNAENSDSSIQAYLSRRGVDLQCCRHFHLIGSLGCVGKCSFCIHEQEYVGLHDFSFEYLFKHIAHLHEKYRVNVLTIGGEYFIKNAAFAAKFTKEMKSRFPEIYWRTITRAEALTEKCVEVLAESNCFLVNFGYESGSQRILNLMNKRTTVTQNINAYKNCLKFNMSCLLNIIVGHPGEDIGSIYETLSSVKEAGISGCGVFYVTPYPGGRVWDWAVENHLITDTHAFLCGVSDKDASKFSINLTGLPTCILRAANLLLNAQMSCNSWKRFRVMSDFVQSFVVSKKLPIPIIFIKILVYVYSVIYISLAFVCKNKFKPFTAFDKKGVLAPSNVVIGKPHRYFSSEDIDRLFSENPPKKHILK